jgi:hypothetical protein
MTTTILPIAQTGASTASPPTTTMRVMVHIQAEILEPHTAQRRANVWLAHYAGHLLMAAHPELILAEPLQWRFDVVLSRPQHDRPGSITQHTLGRLYLDARTGEVLAPDALLADLTAHAAALDLP